MFHRHSPYGKLIKHGGLPVSGIQPHPSNKSCHTVVYQMCRDDNTLEHFRVLGQNSHDDSFVAIGGVTRQRHDQWLRKPSVRRCTDVFRSLYVFCVKTVTMTALSPLAVSPDSDTTSDYESPQSDVVRTYFGPCMFLCQNSHDDSFVAIGGVTRQQLRKPSIGRCTVYGRISIPVCFLCQNSHDDSFVTIGGVTRQRHDQWLGKPPARQLDHHWLNQKETVSSTIKELSPWRLFAVLMLLYSWTCISK